MLDGVSFLSIHCSFRRRLLQLSSVGHREQQAESRDENRRPRRRQQQLEMAEAITLSSGYRMPIIGLGVWRMESKSIRDLILSAISIGYRHFDCAGNAFSFSPHRRIPACKDSLKKLQLDYLDLYLVHFPVATRHTGGGAANAEWFGTISCLDDPVIKRNTVVIPKTSKIDRLHENLKLFDFTISDEDVEKIKGIDRKYRTNQPAKFWGIDLYA
ncbi:hypothetical protein GW17_00008365 [Ensete ventricosum]|nr:hypothetical protein GW17_00008365 [Ensete ventricosum]